MFLGITKQGNEFGHPEWIDFPRPGNGNSYHHARRRWDLPKDPTLRYGQLSAFDAGMMCLEGKYHILASPPVLHRVLSTL